MREREREKEERERERERERGGGEVIASSQGFRRWIKHLAITFSNLQHEMRSLARMLNITKYRYQFSLLNRQLPLKTYSKLESSRLSIKKILLPVSKSCHEGMASTICLA